MTFPALDRVVTWASAYIRPAQPPIPGVIPSTLAADLAAVVAMSEAARKLMNEVRGAFGYAELALRDALGNTNAKCLRERAEQLAALLSREEA